MCQDEMRDQETKNAMINTKALQAKQQLKTSKRRGSLQPVDTYLLFDDVL